MILILRKLDFHEIQGSVQLYKQKFDTNGFTFPSDTLLPFKALIEACYLSKNNSLSDDQELIEILQDTLEEFGVDSSNGLSYFLKFDEADDILMLKFSKNEFSLTICRGEYDSSMKNSCFYGFSAGYIKKYIYNGWKFDLEFMNNEFVQKNSEGRMGLFYQLFSESFTAINEALNCKEPKFSKEEYEKLPLKEKIDSFSLYKTVIQPQEVVNQEHQSLKRSIMNELRELNLGGQKLPPTPPPSQDLPKRYTGPPPGPPTPPGAKKKDYTCTSCGQTVNLNDAFCKHCGAKDPIKHHCTGCGKEIEKLDKFCKHCGGEQGNEMEALFKDEIELKKQGGISLLEAKEDTDYMVIGFSQPNIPVYPLFNKENDWFLSPGRRIRKITPTILRECEIWIDGKKFGTVTDDFICNIYVKNQ